MLDNEHMIMAMLTRDALEPAFLIFAGQRLPFTSALP